MRKKIVLSCQLMLPYDALVDLGKRFNLTFASSCHMTEAEVLKEFKDAQGIIIGGEEIITKNVAESISPQWIIFLGIQPETSFEEYGWKKFHNIIYKTGGGENTVAKTTVDQVENHLQNGNEEQSITVVGTGNIGQKVLKELHERHPYVYYSGGRGEKESLKSGYKFLDLREAFSFSGVITLHLKLVPNVTEKLIKLDHLASMPTNALLINNARAQIVDFAALETMLHLRPDIRVIFDTYYPDRVSDELGCYKNFTFTRHSAASSEETRTEYGRNLLRIIREIELI